MRYIKKYNLRECEIVHTRAQLGISNRFYFHHHVSKCVLEFESLLIGYGDKKLLKEYKKTFGDFEE